MRRTTGGMRHDAIIIKPAREKAAFESTSRLHDEGAAPVARILRRGEAHGAAHASTFVAWQQAAFHDVPGL